MQRLSEAEIRQKLKEMKQKERERAKKELLNILDSNYTIYTILRHVSHSKMMRYISCYIIKDNEIKDISRWIAKILGYRQAKSGGIKVKGNEPDMGHYLIYNLSCTLFSSEDMLQQKWI